MLDILKFGDVEIHRATAPFTAGGKQYAAGSWVIKTAQPYGAVRQDDAREAELSGSAHVPGRPARAAVRRHRSYAVDADWACRSIRSTSRSTRRSSSSRRSTPVTAAAPARPRARTWSGPESYGAFKMVAELQKANVPTFRAAKAFEGHARRYLHHPAVGGRSADPRTRREGARHPGDGRGSSTSSTLRTSERPNSRNSTAFTPSTSGYGDSRVRCLCLTSAIMSSVIVGRGGGFRSIDRLRMSDI